MLARWTCVFLLLALPCSVARCQEQPSSGLGVSTGPRIPQNPNPSTQEAGILTPVGQAIFAQQCSRCHGDKGEGSANAPSLQVTHDPGTVTTALQVGPGGMPSFAGKYSLEEMKSVADYVTQVIAVRSLDESDPQLFQQYGKAVFDMRCAKCHGDAGQGVSGVINIGGPNIQAEHDAAGVMTAMEVGPSHMPQFAYVLSVPEMRAVANYVTRKIAVIPLGGGDIVEGGKLFRQNCAPCHHTTVRGGALVFTGINAPALSGKSPAILAGAIRWGPGPMPSFPPSVFDDHQLNSIVKYVEFVQQPPSAGGSPLDWYGPVAEGFAAWMIMFGIIGIAVWIEWGGKG